MKDVSTKPPAGGDSLNERIAGLSTGEACSIRAEAHEESR